MYSYNPYYERYLAHYGVLGMHWGIRRYQPYTHGQKGIFKGLKKKKRADIKSLKKDLRAYKKQGNEEGIKSVKSQIKDIKKNYKLDIADLKKQFRTENYNAYKEKVAQSGSYNQVDKIKKELTPEQLNMATNRLNAEAAFNASAVNHDKSVQNLKLKADKINKIADIANAGIRVADAVRTVENMLGYDNKARKLSFEATASGALQRLKTAEGMNPKDLPNNLFNKRQLKALTDEYEHNKALKDKGTIEKNRISEETANVQKWKAAQELYKAEKERQGLGGQQPQPQPPQPQPQPPQPQPQPPQPQPKPSGNDSAFRKTLQERVTSGKGTGSAEALAAYDRAIKAGKSEVYAQAQANKSYYQNAKADYGAIPVALAREGNMEKIADHILTNPFKYKGTSSMAEASEYANKNNLKLSTLPKIPSGESYTGGTITLKNGEVYGWDPYRHEWSAVGHT